jgi:hypothetical protein
MFQMVLMTYVNNFGGWVKREKMLSSFEHGISTIQGWEKSKIRHDDVSSDTDLDPSTTDYFIGHIQRTHFFNCHSYSYATVTPN